MLRILVSVTTLLLISFFSFNIFAWNALGHMIVANIAYQQLKPNVRQKADDLLSYFYKEYPYMKSFQEVATWPDKLHGQRIETFSRWHYIDVAFSTDGTPLKNMVDSDNIVWAISAIKTIIENERANPYERARFLAFLIHLVGDIHQPLHTVTYISARNPEGDKGGNEYFIKFFGEKMRLHTVWDRGLGIYADDETLGKMESLTNDITKRFPKEYFNDRINDLNLNHWTKEGMDSSQKLIYSTPENKTPNANYVTSGKDLSEQTVALAGYRLAEMLNQLLK